MYSPKNTPPGKFQVLPPGNGQTWKTATLQFVAQALKDFSGDPARDYHNMIFYAFQGSPKGTIRLGDVFFRFHPFQ